MLNTIFEGEAGLAISPIMTWQSLGLGRDEALIQVDITGTATVIVRGKTSLDAEWRDIKTVTASDMQPVFRVPYFQLEITANSGSVSAYLAT